MIRTILVDGEGTIVHEYTSVRLFGRIQRDGRWYRAAHKQGLPHVYVLEESAS